MKSNIDRDKAYWTLHAIVVPTLTIDDGDPDDFVDLVFEQITTTSDHDRLRSMVEIDWDAIDQAIEDVRETRFNNHEEAKIG